MFASGSNSSLGIIKETVLGTTPATPQLAQQRFASFSANTTMTELLDNSITGSRDYPEVGSGNTTVEGSLSGPYGVQNYDSLLESVFFGTWTTNVLKAGSTMLSHTIEQRFSDIAQYNLFKGMVCNTISIDAPIDSLVTAEFGLMGFSQVPSATSVDADGYDALVASKPFTSCGGTITIDGVPNAVIQSINFTLDNGITANYVWGNCSTESFTPGRINVTGTLTAFLEDMSMVDKYLNQTYVDIDITFTDGANTHTYNMNKCKLTSADVPVDGEGPVIASFGFRALKDTVENTTIMVTRSI